MNRMGIVLFSSLLVFIFLSVSVNGLNVWPGKLEITIPEGYKNQDIVHPIQVTNTRSYAINATAVPNNPANTSLSEGYSFIPNVSWIKIEPDILNVPAGSSSLFQLIVDIPENEVPLHYNESWETWVTISSDEYSGGVEGGIAFKAELAVKVYIDTPPGEGKIQIQNLFLPIGIILGIVVVLLLFFFLKIKRK